MAGGGGMKKTIINLCLDKPVHVYLGGATFLWAVRQYQTANAYNYYFGKIEFLRNQEKAAALHA